MNREYMKKASFIANTIRMGLAMILPILFIGSMTVLLNGFPSQAYQDFLNSFMGGALRSILLMIQKTTVGMLAVYMTIALNVSYMNQTLQDERPVSRFGSLLGCVTGFFIIVGFFAGETDLSLLSGQGMFSALLSGIIGSALYRRFEEVFKTGRSVFVDGADSAFNAALSVIKPFLAVVLCFAVTNYLITICFEVESVQHLFMNVMDALFLKMHRSYSSGLLFTFLISVMWWFGIHGNNVLNQVAEDLFTEIIPGEIVSKSFIDTFVIMGGTGCLIGLLLAMIIFGRRNSTRKLARMAFVPCVFNISELLVFGFPVIYNPLMVIPFILAPVLCYTNAFLCTRFGFLPKVANTVVWTTPPLISGYIATGSVRGIIVQIINILISVACYAPFMIMHEKRSLNEYSASMDELVYVLKKSKEKNEMTILTDCGGSVGRLAKMLVSDLQDSLNLSATREFGEKPESPLLTDYALKYDDTGKCIGAETSLNWDHIRYGTVYQPLVLELAKESGDLYGLETYVAEKAVGDYAELRKEHGDGFRLGISVSIPTFRDRRFVPFLQELAKSNMLRAGNIYIEINGDAKWVESEEAEELIDRIRTFGYTFASDDNIGG